MTSLGSGPLPKVLVACPTFDGKSYALDAYVAAYHALDYSPRDLFMVDTTRTEAYCRELVERGIPALRVPPLIDWPTTQALAYALIARRARERGYPFVLSLEADTIIPPDGLSRLVDVAQSEGLRFVAQASPLRASVAAAVPQSSTAELGCTLIDSGLLAQAVESLRRQPGNLLDIMVSLAGPGGAATVDLFPLTHLDGGSADYWQFPGRDLRFGADPDRIGNGPSRD